MIIVGIDENGLGPVLGPLVVTACSFRANEYNSEVFWSLSDAALPADDSKVVFKKGKKKSAETAVMKWLRLFKYTANSARDLYQATCQATVLPCPEDKHHLCRFNQRLTIPQFGASEVEIPLDIIKRFQQKQIQPLSFDAHTICPGQFNATLDTGRVNKLQFDFELMMHLIQRLQRLHPNEFILALCGKVGGTRCYLPWFDAAEIAMPKILEEERHQSRYQLGDSLEIAFIKDGDGYHLPVAVASMVGKYLRELQMTEINELLNPGNPHISGYRDPKTKQFIVETEAARERIGLPNRCFIRNC